jgi:hypothetical protein
MAKAKTKYAHLTVGLSEINRVPQKRPRYNSKPAARHDALARQALHSADTLVSLLLRSIVGGY